MNGPGGRPGLRAPDQAKPGLLGSRAIKWNFTKFLVGRDGRVIARYAPSTKPEALEAAVAAALAEPAPAS